MPAYEATQWAANQTARPSLTIGGEDYTSQLLQWNVSDASAYKNGLITTSGTLALASLGTLTGLQIEDYQKNLFKRGTEVVLDLVVWDSSTNSQIVVRHPRGLLYVMGSSYSLTSQQLELNIGCIISLYLLDDEENYEYLRDYQQLPLQEDQQTISNIGATLAAKGMAIYQDNQGQVVPFKYFSNSNPQNSYWDQYTGGPGEWVSINGVTAFSADPIKGASPLADEIDLSYSFQDFEVSGEDPSAPRETISQYYIEYPAIVYERVQIQGDFDPLTGTGSIPNGIDIASLIGAGAGPGGPSSPDDGDGSGGTAPSDPGGCGNAPRPKQAVYPSGPSGVTIINNITYPIGGGIGATFTGCSDNYVTSATTRTLTARSRELSYSKFEAYGGLVSYKFEQKKGPAIELNNQYYADLLSYCYSTNANRCNPGGGCGYPGLREVKHVQQETFYEYGVGEEAGLLKAEETHVWQNLLSATKPGDWRSGIVNGEPSSFVHLSDNILYRSTVRRIEYSREGKWNKTIEKVWTSQANTGNGISGAG